MTIGDNQHPSPYAAFAFKCLKRVAADDLSRRRPRGEASKAGAAIDIPLTR